MTGSAQKIPPSDEGSGKNPAGAPPTADATHDALLGKDAFAEPAFDARRRFEALADATRNWGEEEPKKPKTPWAILQFIAFVSRNRSTILKSCAALAIVAALGYEPLRRATALTSTEAVVNASLATLRAPIEGQLSAAGALSAGAAYDNGALVFSIHNARVDNAGLNAARTALAQAHMQIAALEARQSAMEARRRDLTRQEETFRRGRIEQLTQRIADLDGQIIAAKARHTEAVSVLARAQTLAEQGFMAQAKLDQAIRDASVARGEAEALEARRAGARVEKDAAVEGAYIGDSYNDTPQSHQKAGELAVEAAEIKGRLAGLVAETKRVENDIAEEQRRLAELRGAEVRLSSAGRVWETLVASGAYVNKGQDLVRFVDCSSALVTVSLSESAYMRLRVGQQATFRPRDGAPAMSGEIVQLSGPSAPSATSIIDPNRLTRDHWRANVRIPALADMRDCGLGRTGLVTFKAEESGLAALWRSLSPF